MGDGVGEVWNADAPEWAPRLVVCACGLPKYASAESIRAAQKTGGLTLCWHQFDAPWLVPPPPTG